MQSRVLVTARRFEDMSLVAKPVTEPDQLTRRARHLSDEEIADLAQADHDTGQPRNGKQAS